uniref:Uncharacterized protein n=1 Tax=Opuntia streptacantha TaxID=393608 RepID=A0A7C9E5S5_OPUST
MMLQVKTHILNLSISDLKNLCSGFFISFTSLVVKELPLFQEYACLSTIATDKSFSSSFVIFLRCITIFLNSSAKDLIFILFSFISCINKDTTCCFSTVLLSNILRISSHISLSYLRSPS